MTNYIRYPIPKKTENMIERERKKFIQKVGCNINKSKFIEKYIHPELTLILNKRGVVYAKRNRK